MFSSFITTPAHLIDYEDILHKVEFYSGFFPPHLTESDEVCMNVGYIMREDQQVKKDKLKSSYIAKGVKNDREGFLSIPKYLQKENNTILDVFGAFGYSYYGEDPEEEKRKQYYIDEGVKKEKMVYSYKYMIPNKFKDDEEKIEEIKELFKASKIEYY
jgi:Asp-tRNA(Asn)/Glu-tRNA(Gln) amidotransferase C subunit